VFQVSPCSLEKKLQEFIELICNVEAMEAAVMEMQYDTKKSPLGKTAGGVTECRQPCVVCAATEWRFYIAGATSLCTTIVRSQKENDTYRII